MNFALNLAFLIGPLLKLKLNRENKVQKVILLLLPSIEFIHGTIATSNLPICNTHFTSH